MVIRSFATLTLIALLAAPGGATSDPARTFLMTGFNLSAAEIGRLDGGGVVSRTLEVKNRREVATLGIVRINTSPSSYVERLADITTFKRTDDVLQVGTFSSPPQREDVASLIIDEAELKRLRECRVEDCDVRLVRGRDRTRPARHRLARGRRLRQREPAGAAPARRLCRPLSPERRGGGDGVRRSRAAPECRPGVRVVDRCRQHDDELCPATASTSARISSVFRRQA